MKKNTIKIPNRKWYSLEQAKKYIYKETGEEIEIIDLIHHWINEEIEVYTNFYLNTHSNIYILGNLMFKSLCDIEKVIPNVFIHLDSFPYSFISPDNLFTYFSGKDLISLLEIANELDPNEEKITIEEENIFIQGYVSIGIDRNGKNLFLMEKERYILKNGLLISEISSLISPKGFEIFEDSSIHHLENKKMARLYFEFNYKIDRKIKLDRLFILHDDLNSFIYGKNDRAEIEYIFNKGGRPTPYKEPIIQLAQKIFKSYPENNRETIAAAVLELVNNMNCLNDQNLTLSKKTVARYLRENNIGKYRGKSIRINNIERFKQ